VEQKRKEDFYVKQEHHDELRKIAQEERDEAQRLFLEQQELMEQRRVLILRKFREDEEVCQ